MFGQRLRELRKGRRFSQRELARRVGIDFTYLSKIENDRMPPPSEKTVRRLADELGADPDELILLAGKVPSDIADIMRRSPEAVKMFRSLSGEVRTKDDWRRLLQSRRLAEDPPPPRPTSH